MRTLVPFLALALLAACPEQIGQQCPQHTVSIGQYDINFAGQHPAGECKADSGTPAAPDASALALDDAGTRTSALCFGPVDGGPGIYLVIPTKGTRSSPLGDDGGFRFTGHSDPVPGTACGCLIGIDETFEGNLLTSPAGTPFQLQPDGGLPEVIGLTATLTDTLTTPSSGGCLCNLPCPVIYKLTGTRK